VVDPIYKVLSGDENNATEMTKFTNFFDKITKKLDVATVYAHHHSKGDQTKKVAMDRMSGSGVFARDPDAVLDFTSIETLEINRRALKMEYAALRGFPIQEPRYVWFEFPEFYEDADGIRSAIAAYKQEKKREAERLDENEKQRNKEQREKDLWEDRLSKLDDAFEKLEDEAGKVECKLMAENLDISVKTLYAWAERFDFYECSKGKNAQIWRNYV
jgi:RecA-family ATPase